MRHREREEDKGDQLRQRPKAMGEELLKTCRKNTFIAHHEAMSEWLRDSQGRKVVERKD